MQGGPLEVDNKQCFSMLYNGICGISNVLQYYLMYDIIQVKIYFTTNLQVKLHWREDFCYLIKQQNILQLKTSPCSVSFAF